MVFNPKYMLIFCTNFRTYSYFEHFSHVKNTKIGKERIIFPWFIPGGGGAGEGGGRDGFGGFFFGVVLLSASPPALFQYLEEVYKKDEDGLFTKAQSHKQLWF